MKKMIALLSLAGTLTAVAGETAAPPPAATNAEAFSEENLQFDFALGLLRRGLFSEAATEFDKFIAAYPQSSRLLDARLQRAEAAYGQHDYAAAAPGYFLYLQKKASVDVALRLRYAICLHELRRTADALQVLTPLLPLAKREEYRTHRSAIYYYAALASRDSGDLAAAAKNFLAAADLPADARFAPLALYALGEIHLSQKQPGLAANIFGRLLKEYPGHELATAARLAESDAQRQGGALEPAIANFRNLLDSSAPDIRARARYGLAGALAEAGKKDEAAAQAQEVLRDPHARAFYDGANLLLATLACGQGHYTEAIAAAEAVTSTCPYAESALATKAWALYQAQKNAEALAAAVAGTEKYPANADFPYFAGRACWALGQYPQAAAHFITARDRALKTQNPLAESAALEAALAWEKAAKPAEAVKLYVWARDNFPTGKNTIDVRFGLGRALMADGRHEASLPVWEELRRHQGLTAEQQENALFQRVVAYYYLKQYSNLRADCEKLLQEFPEGKNVPEALYWLAWRDLEDKKFSAALARYQEFTRRYSQHPLAGKARYYTGAALLKLEREDEAAAVFYSIISNGGALEGRELLWLAQQLGSKEPEKAAEVFAALLQKEKDPLMRVVALLGRARLCRDEQKWEKAIGDVQAALGLIPQLDTKAAVAAALENEANFGLAVALRESGRLELAAAALAKVNVSPDDPFTAQLHFERGQLAFAQKKYAAAGELLLRVGLLVADADLAGRALTLAAEACELNHDPQRARVCYDELAGTLAGSFGQLHPDSVYARRAREKLATLTSPNAGSK